MDKWDKWDLAVWAVFAFLCGLDGALIVLKLCR